MQTQQVVSKGVFGMAIQVVKTQGVLALYNGLTAALGRQVRPLISVYRKSCPDSGIKTGYL